MRRPFLRVYLGVVLVVLLVQALSLIQLRREVSAEANRRVVAALEPGVRVMRHRIGRHHGPVPRRVLSEIAGNHGMEANVIRERDPEFDLTEAERNEIRTEQLVMLERDEEDFIFAELRPDMYLRLGPVPSMVPAQRIPQRLVQTGFILLLIGGVLFLLLSPFERRLRALATVAGELGAGDTDARVGDKRNDAIGQVAQAFDEMAGQVGDTIQGQRELLRAVSHELRTPIARLLFLVDDVRDASDESERAEKLQRCDVSLEEMKSLVDELLTFSRMSGRDANIASEPVALHEVLAGTIESARELRAEVEVQADLQAVEIKADSALVKRAVGNLLSNAVRHSEHQVSLSLSLAGDRAQIVVEDDGSGIPEADRDRVFEPFARLDESRQRDSGGAGLGLAIVRRIAEAHEGDARVERSELGGARLVLELPVG